MNHTCVRTPNGRVRREPYSGPVTLPAPPTRQEIARLAYSYWEGRGRLHGFHEQDWYKAERELARRRNASFLG
ncbi:MAG: DUF2934 domain-containing protein [Candidatus Solibacter sp.]